MGRRRATEPPLPLEEPIAAMAQAAAACPPPRSCQLGAEPLTGGSGAATRPGPEAETSGERRCAWERCLHRCPPFSCSGPFHLEKYRLTCNELTACIEPAKKEKKDWCWESEGQLIPYCAHCPRPPYLCPAAEQPEQPCPTPTLKDIPLHTWSAGHPTPNYGDAPFPYASRRLRPPRAAPPTPLEVAPSCQTSFAQPRMELCSVALGGPGQRTRRWRLEELAYNPQRFFDKRAAGFRESAWCAPLANGGVLAPLPPACKPCACPLL